MEPLTRTQPEPSRVSMVIKELLRGLAIGLGIYVAFVIVHAILLGML